MSEFDSEQLEHLSFVAEVLDANLTDMLATTPLDEAAALQICRQANMLPATAIGQEIDKLKPYQPDVLKVSQTEAAERMAQIISHSQRLGNLLPFARGSIEEIAGTFTQDLEWTLESEPNTTEEQARFESLAAIQKVLSKLAEHPLYPDLVVLGLQEVGKKSSGAPQSESSRAVAGYLCAAKTLEAMDLGTILDRVFPDCAPEARKRRLGQISNMLNPKQTMNGPVRRQLRLQGRAIQRGKLVELSKLDNVPKNVYRILSTERDASLSTGESIYTEGESLIVWEAVELDEQ